MVTKFIRRYEKYINNIKSTALKLNIKLYKRNYFILNKIYLIKNDWKENIR